MVTDTSKLSPRLESVAELLGQGIARKQIAALLGLSLHTIKGYVKDVYRVYDVHSNVEFIIKWRSKR